MNIRNGIARMIQRSIVVKFVTLLESRCQNKSCKVYRAQVLNSVAGCSKHMAINNYSPLHKIPARERLSCEIRFSREGVGYDSEFRNSVLFL